MTKYKNKKCEYQNIKFDSIKERNHFIYLKQLEEKGEIWNLRLQVKFPILIDSRRICSYIADFVYEDENGKHVVDVKSPITSKNPTFRLKKKLVEVQYRVEIEIVWHWFYFVIQYEKKWSEENEHIRKIRVLHW